MDKGGEELGGLRGWAQRGEFHGVSGTKGKNFLKFQTVSRTELPGPNFFLRNREGSEVLPLSDKKNKNNSLFNLFDLVKFDPDSPNGEEQVRRKRINWEKKEYSIFQRYFVIA
jgi:hypothetical protein